MPGHAARLDAAVRPTFGGVGAGTGHRASSYSRPSAARLLMKFPLFAIVAALTVASVARGETISEALVSAYNAGPDLNQKRALVRAIDENIGHAASGFRPPNQRKTGSWLGGALLGRRDGDDPCRVRSRHLAAPNLVHWPLTRCALTRWSIFPGCAITGLGFGRKPSLGALPQLPGRSGAPVRKGRAPGRSGNA